MVVRQSQLKVLNLRILHLIETFQLPHITWVFMFTVHCSVCLMTKTRTEMLAFVNKVAHDTKVPHSSVLKLRFIIKQQ